jgi:hypothetical protein
VAHMVIVRHQGVVILGDRDLRPAARWAAVRDQLVESLPLYERVLGPNTYLPACLTPISAQLIRPYP